jgi:hypothetical protein
MQQTTGRQIQKSGLATRSQGNLPEMLAARAQGYSDADGIARRPWRIGTRFAHPDNVISDMMFRLPDHPTLAWRVWADFDEEWRM